MLLDLDGVVYVGDQVVSGAAEAVEWLVRERIPHRFLTNTTSRPRQAVAAKLAALGIPAPEDRILTPAVGVVGWMWGGGSNMAAASAARVAKFACMGTPFGWLFNTTSP